MGGQAASVKGDTGEVQRSCGATDRWGLGSSAEVARRHRLQQYIVEFVNMQHHVLLDFSFLE